MQNQDSRFDENGILLESQWIHVYGFDYMNVFTIGYDAYLAKGMTLPLGTTLVQPPAIQAGNAAVFDSSSNSWYVTADHRGETVYNKQGQQATKVDYLGDYRSDVTPLKPNSGFDNWDSSQNAWIKDPVKTASELKEQQKAQMSDGREKAEEMIDICQDKLSIPYFSGSETPESVSAELELWRIYRLQCISFLNGILTNLPYAPDSQEYKEQKATEKAQADAEAEAQRQAELAQQQADEAAKEQAAADAAAAAEAAKSATKPQASTDTKTPTAK